MAAVVRDMDSSPATVTPDTPVEEVIATLRDLHLSHYINLFGGTVFLEPPDTSAQEAARVVHESGHNRLPVVEDGWLVGVVTRLDVLGALAA